MRLSFCGSLLCGGARSLLFLSSIMALCASYCWASCASCVGVKVATLAANRPPPGIALQILSNIMVWFAGFTWRCTCIKARFNVVDPDCSSLIKHFSSSEFGSDPGVQQMVFAACQTVILTGIAIPCLVFKWRTARGVFKTSAWTCSTTRWICGNWFISFSFGQRLVIKSRASLNPSFELSLFVKCCDWTAVRLMLSRGPGDVSPNMPPCSSIGLCGVCICIFRLGVVALSVHWAVLFCSADSASASLHL